MATVKLSKIHHNNKTGKVVVTLNIGNNLVEHALNDPKPVVDNIFKIALKEYSESLKKQAAMFSKLESEIVEKIEEVA